MAKILSWHCIIFEHKDYLRGIAHRHDHAGDAHAAVAGASLHADEASLAPGRAPGVLDQPVVLAAVGVGVVAARLIIIDAACVVKHVGGHDGSGGGVDIDQLLELSLVGAPVVVDASHRGTRIVASVVVVASPLLSKVWGATLLLHHPVVVPDDPLHVCEHKGAVTPDHGLAVVSAVHEVLLGQVVLEDSGGLPHARVNGGHGGEVGAAPT